MKRFLRAILVALALIAFMAPCAFAGELMLHWTNPCYQARQDTCFLDSTTLERDLKGMRIRLVRFSPPDTLDLGTIDLTGRECRVDSALYEIDDGTQGVVLYNSVNLAGQESCIYASYLYAVQASTASVSQPGLLGSYYRDKVLGSLVGSRVDSQVNFDWATASPFPGCPADSFSVRWQGFLRVATTGFHTFRLNVNDAGRLWIGPWKVLDDWATGDGWHNVSGSAMLTAGVDYAVTLEMKELWYICGAKLYWTQPGQAEQLVSASALTH